MNGVHDMGGQQGFGPVKREPHEPLFHADWEKRALGLTLAMGATGQWNIDLSRSARESLPPAIYLGSSYYEIWIHALEVLMLERGLVQTEELQDGQLHAPPQPVARVLKAQDVDGVLARGAPVSRTPTTPARFQAGNRVMVKNRHPSGHTRAPRYVRGHVGTIALVHGVHILADRHAAQHVAPFDIHPEWLYTVVFDGQTLWGSDTTAGVQVSVDAWESYLEPVDDHSLP
jgi:nitrile hydratase subunit beta